MKTHAEKLAARDAAIVDVLDEVWVDGEYRIVDAQQFQLALIKRGFLVVPL